MSTTRFAVTTRQSAVAFVAASITTLALLSSIVAQADRVQADEQRLAQAATPETQQVVVVASRARRS